MKLLVNDPAGAQELIEIGVGGAYFDPDRVLWDERIDGTLTEITLGGMVRVDGVAGIEATETEPAVDAVPASLVFDQSVYDARVIVRSVPRVVTMAQARKALILAGVSIASVDTAIASIPDAIQRALAETDWEYAGTVQRDSLLVASLGAALGLTSDGVENLFIQAAAL
jgi:hypothetical protein